MSNKQTNKQTKYFFWMKQQTLLGATIKRRTINIPPIVKAAVHGEVSNQRYIFNREGQTA